MTRHVSWWWPFSMIFASLESPESQLSNEAKIIQNGHHHQKIWSILVGNSDLLLQNRNLIFFREIFYLKAETFYRETCFYIFAKSWPAHSAIPPLRVLHVALAAQLLHAVDPWRRADVEPRAGGGGIHRLLIYCFHSLYIFCLHKSAENQQHSLQLINSSSIMNCHQKSRENIEHPYKK